MRLELMISWTPVRWVASPHWDLMFSSFGFWFLWSQIFKISFNHILCTGCVRFVCAACMDTRKLCMYMRACVYLRDHLPAMKTSNIRIYIWGAETGLKTQRQSWQKSVNWLKSEQIEENKLHNCGWCVLYCFEKHSKYLLPLRIWHLNEPYSEVMYETIYSIFCN